MNYIGVQDLEKRWIYTRQGVYKIVRARGFPEPMFTINRGRTKVWFVGDIVAFERKHPEVRDEKAKHRKVAGFAVGILRKQDRQG